MDLRRVAIVTLLLAVQPLSADYFDDQGNLLGVYRTDYTNPNEGTDEDSDPLVIKTSGCYFPQSEFGPGGTFIEVHRTMACPDGPLEYPGGSYARGDFSATSFWVLSANVEYPSFDDNSDPNLPAPLGNLQGPPGLSTDTNGYPDLLSFSMFPIGAGTRFIAYLFIDNEGTSGQKFAATPFLSIGGHKNRGNNGLVGRMNVANAPHKTTWTSTVYFASPGPGGALLYYIAAVSKWGDVKRILWVQLYHHLVDYSDDVTPGVHRHWNWPAKNSFWYPGADMAFIDAEDIETHCGPGVGNVPEITMLGQAYSYSLDWEFLFSCVSNQLGLFDSGMPTSTGVPIIGVHWIVELTGDSSMTASVVGQEMVN